MKLGLLALVASVIAVIAPAALASSDQHPRSAQVNSLDVDPGTVVAGDSTHVSVALRNPADDASPKRDLLIRLQTPSLVNAEKNLARAPIGSIPAGGRKTIDLDVAIPASVLGGDFGLVACRAQHKSPNKCGQSKQQTTLTVLTPAGLTLTPATKDFGSQVAGTASAVQAFIVTNTGDAPSGVPAVAISGDAAQFPLSANTCTASLPAGGSCGFDVAFAPTSTGAKNAGVGVVAVPGGGASATLSGTGLAPANLTIAAASKDFGIHATGTTSPAQTFTVTNTGGVPSGTIATSVAGADAGQFTKSADNCNGQTLVPGASCTVGGAFAPSSVGAKAASLQASASPGGTAAATLSGTGATPANLAISPTPKDFGTNATATTSPAQTFTVTNTGAVPSGTIATSVTGADAGQFAKSADNCNGQTLTPGASCTVDGAFAPTSVGGKTASLQASASPGGTAAAALSGTGATPANLTISPTPHGFGAQVIGSTTTQGFTVTNNGGVPSGSITTGLTGTNSDQFTKSADNCNGQTLAPGASCTVNGAFAPTSSGAKAASLQVSAAPGGTASASLTGTGQTPAQLTITPPSKDFGNVFTGTSSPKQTFTITNTGEQTALIGSAMVTGSRFQPSNFTCSSSLPGGASCGIDIAFAPQAGDTGAFNSSLQISSNPGGNPSASLSGNAAATAASLRIGLRRFGDSSPVVYGTGGTIGTNSTGLNGVQVWIKNIGEADAHISPATIPVTLNNAKFTVDNTSSCGVVPSDGFVSQIVFTNTTIAGGSECHIDIEAGHETSGAWDASFTIAGSPGGSITGTITGI